jgi:hypothetical protein
MLVAFACGLGVGFVAGVFLTCVAMVLLDRVRVY